MLGISARLGITVVAQRRRKRRIGMRRWPRLPYDVRQSPARRPVKSPCTNAANRTDASPLSNIVFYLGRISTLGAPSSAVVVSATTTASAASSGERGGVVTGVGVRLAGSNLTTRHHVHQYVEPPKLVESRSKESMSPFIISRVNRSTQTKRLRTREGLRCV